MTLAEYLDAKSIPEPNTGCVIWTGAVNNRGYGWATWKGRTRSATHLALECVGVEVPKGMDACHRCDVPPCINDAHLFVGTRKRNMADAQAKGRLVGYGVREFCKQGHPLSGDNVRTDPKSGKRSCKTCKKRWEKEHYARSEKRRTRWRHARPTIN